MRRWFVSCVVLFFAGVLPVGAQIPTGKIEGKVVEGLPVGRTLDAAKPPFPPPPSRRSTAVSRVVW